MIESMAHVCDVSTDNQIRWSEASGDAPSYANTTIIFDWDDTLLSSSWLASEGLTLNTERIPPKALDQLKSLETAVVRLLTKALLYGDIHLVTNAHLGWVAMSAEKFLPAVVPLLKSLQVISARDACEKDYPFNPEMWKIETFRSELGYILSDEMLNRSFGNENIRRNIMSLGDSHYERTALQKVSAMMDKTFCKTIKLVSKPTIAQIIKQLEIVYENFDYLCTHSGDIDMVFEVEMFG